MSNLSFNCESLNKVLENREVTKEEILEIFESSIKNPLDLFRTATVLRNSKHGKVVTFSKKAFFNIVNLCRDTCSYCTYKAKPGQEKLSLMSLDDVKKLSKMAKKYTCTEALFVTGERPEEVYSEARKWLKDNGFSSTAEFLIHASEIALKEGIFPHTNAGNLTKNELSELQKTNVSMGIMLENVSDRLTKKEMPHYFAPSKFPKSRLKVLNDAGELRIPMTTGILVGIGETPYEIIDSVYAIKKLNDTYGNIQEVILQNFQPKSDTVMKGVPGAEENYFKIVVALTRIILPEMNIQIPPNLSPKSYQDFLSVGINDWGGISPLTPDYVNPEFNWPKISNVEKDSINAGYQLKARFPVYPEFFGFVNTDLQNEMSELNDGKNLVREDYWK